MKHIVFKYIAIAAALLATAVNASAQYNIEGGVGTSKQVTGPDSDGNYTIRLETFATGTTTVTESSTPVNVVLVLDVSGSMAWPKGDYSQSTKTSYSYNDIVSGQVEYFRQYSQNSSYIEKIYAEAVQQTNGTYRYYLYISPDMGTGNNQGTYLTADGGTTTGRRDAAYATSETAAIVTPSTGNSRYFFQGTSRIKALQDAVCVFIDEIEKNDHLDKGGNERAERLHNKISIVKFAGNGNNTSYNNNETIVALMNTEGNVDDMKAAVNALIPKGATQAGNGMSLASTQLQAADADANKVVVMFTDGEPSDNYAAIGQARTIKNNGTIVYTVGVFTNSPSTNGNIWKYMNYVSSNYPNASSINNAGTGGSDQGYYKDASGNIDLTGIFKSIAEGIGGAEATVGSSTQVRDVVTNSFVLPNTVTAADVHVYTSAATGSASGADDTDPEGWATPVEVTNSVTINIVNVDADGNPIASDDTTTPVANKALFVEGFEYSKADSSEGAGDGNWVGPRFKNNTWTWAGKKLIITFKVKADGEATGGESQTNTGDSGVYIKNEDGSYTCINNYEQPHTTLTVNIKIRKTGLRHGESATFELMQIRPKGYNPDGETLKDKVANLEYNLIGKPVPGTHPSTDPSLSPTDSDPSKYYESLGWVSFKKVILTNMGKDGAEVVKDVLALDPYWVYMVVEDDWGWAYTMTGDANQAGDDGTYTTSSVEVNPFRFHNTEKTNAVKHAEAVMINHFQSKEEGATSYTEHDKSSKVESF